MAYSYLCLKSMVLVGGSGSTGSSLLRTLLNRHSEIFSGAETYLFAYPVLYTHWASYKSRLLRVRWKALKSSGWLPLRGTQILNEDYGWTRPELELLIQKSNSFSDFIQAFFDKPLQIQGATCWVEKSPANAYTFPLFLNTFSQGKVVHIVRNPYDTVASFMARGLDVYYAAATYICNVAFAEINQHSPRQYRLCYEDLVRQPEQSLQALCRFLEQAYEACMLIPRHEKQHDVTQMKGWLHDQTAPISTASIGRFNRLPEAQQILIATTLASFEIHPAYAKAFQLPYTSCQEICKALQYPYLDTKLNPDFLRQIRRYQRKDLYYRTWRNFPTRWGSYPAKML